jgi:hypothetical protein
MADITDERLNELLDDFRDDEPGLSAATLGELRTNVLAATAMPEVRPLAPDAVRPLAPDTPRGRRRALVGLLSAAAVVAALAIGAVAFVPHRGELAPDDQPGTSSQARGLPPMPSKPVNRAGELSAHVTMPTLKTGQYLYLREDYTQNPMGDNEGGVRTDELWITYDLNDEWRNYRTSTGTPQAGTENNIPMDDRGKADEIDSGGMAPAMRKLPSDPAKLYQWLAKKFEHDTDAPAKAVTYLFSNLYVDYYIPPATKAAMYKVLGYLPGVGLTRTTLPNHAQVTVLTRMDPDMRIQIFVNPHDGRVAGYRDIAIDDQHGAKVDHVAVTSYYTQSVVDSIESRP